jgi:hypothetical protein
MRVFRVRLVATLCVFWLASGCHSYVDGLDGGGEGDAGEDLAVGEDLTAPADMTNCMPTVDCVGQCGPVFDPCLGRNVQCGTCPAGNVCNLATHVCETVKRNCVELGAACGLTKNSCGVRLSCPECASGKECDPDTNQCVNCTNVTCEQLGYECGSAWLGCGSRSANQTNCGSCADAAKPVCNPYFNKCEPSCTPAPTPQLCTNAQAECGIISDGCGGYVDCGGCPAGMQCGAQGDANRCQPKEEPVECQAAGRECGEIDSECGGKVKCGDCTPPDVCNANGKCGPPCTVKDCNALGNPQCGTVDDGCGGQKKCNDCPNAVEYTCINNMCCKKKSCAVDYAGKCGVGLDDGCGGTLDCGCASGSCTTTVPGMQGTCCVNTAACAPGACNTSVTNTCNGQPIPCNCPDPANQYCDGTPGTCKPKNTCNTFGANGQNGQPCSNGPAFPNGAGQSFACPCGGGRYCITGAAPSPVATGTQMGTCCTDTDTCTSGGMQACTGTRTNTCTGQVTDCAAVPCANGYCMGGVCVPYNTCSTHGANGQAGQPCSNGNSPAFPRGDGTNLRCPCSGGRLCVNGMTVVSGAQDGTCCQNTASCNGLCNVTPAPVNTCTGQPITCGCPSNRYCNAAQNGTCVLKNTCASLGKTGLVGSGCNDNNFYDDGTGTLIRCPCNNAPPNQNVTCAGDSPSQEGTCQCTPSACANCGQDGQGDGCGGVKNCDCPGVQVCHNNACCTPLTCPAPALGAICGTSSNNCGGTRTCDCPTHHPVSGLPMPNVACTGGTCQCVPTPCNVLGVGTHPNDGCGQPVTCGA